MACCPLHMPGGFLFLFTGKSSEGQLAPFTADPEASLKHTHTQWNSCTKISLRTDTQGQEHIHTYAQRLWQIHAAAAVTHSYTRTHTHCWPVASVFKQAWYWNPAVGRTVGFAEVRSRLLIKVSLLWKLCLWPRAIHTRGVCVCVSVGNLYVQTQETSVWKSV